MEGQGPPGSLPGSSSREGLRHSPAKGFAAALALPPASSPYLPGGAHEGRAELQNGPLGSADPGHRQNHLSPQHSDLSPCQRP